MPNANGLATRLYRVIKSMEVLFHACHRSCHKSFLLLNTSSHLSIVMQSAHVGAFAFLSNITPFCSANALPNVPLHMRCSLCNLSRTIATIASSPSAATLTKWTWGGGKGQVSYGKNGSGRCKFAHKEAPLCRCAYGRDPMRDTKSDSYPSAS